MSPRRHSPEMYQQIANGVMMSVAENLEAQHRLNVATTGVEDGSPTLQGFVGGLVVFAVEGGLDQEDFRQRVNQVITEVWPQVAMDFASHQAGLPPEGRA